MSEEDDNIEVRTKTVSVKYGETVNTGNYNSVRMDVMLSKNIPETEEYDPHIAELLRKAKTWVIDKLHM